MCNSSLPTYLTRLRLDADFGLMLWKSIAAGMLLALIFVGGVTGFNWYLAARDRNATKTDLAAERHVSEQLHASTCKNSRAVETMATQKEIADTGAPKLMRSPRLMASASIWPCAIARMPKQPLAIV